jgi:Ca2+-binding RTX toxin-like protein
VRTLLTGGLGDDTFVYEDKGEGHASERIIDFTISEDTIGIMSCGFAGISRKREYHQQDPLHG